MIFLLPSGVTGDAVIEDLSFLYIGGFLINGVATDFVGVLELEFPSAAEGADSPDTAETSIFFTGAESFLLL